MNEKHRRYPLPATTGGEDCLDLAFRSVAAKGRRRSSLVIRQADYDRVFAVHPDLCDLELDLEAWWGPC